MIERPERAYLPQALRPGRTWGFAVNLYALRSRRNWGIGDFTDLRTFVALAKRLGAGVVGTNPLHALHYVEPEAASPYSPTTRHFRNPLYVDVERVPEFSASGERAAALRARVESPAFAQMLAGLRDEPVVAYARVARAKFSALGECYAVLRELRGPRLAAFRAFVERGGDRLETFALYEALGEHFARDEGRVRGWLTWPEAYRDRDAPQVRAFALKARRRIEYFKYLQWLADDQLAAAAAEASGMAVGLYLDLAVGVDINSADVWAEPASFVLEETVGAPPDPLGPLGQNWGLPPPDPQAMLRGDGRGFADLLAANMAHAGALRLDHVMALLRLFRIPRGQAPSAGIYHDYPFDALLAIAARVSHAAQCSIVGEDLGNVPPGFRDRMQDEAILSYRVLLFERDDAGGFTAPESYPSLALATATTHDLPTLPGWALGRDIAIRADIGLLDAATAEVARRTRREDASRLLAALHARALLGADAFDATHRALDERRHEGAAYESLVRGAYAFLAASPATIVLVQLDDALGELDQINVPGTALEYPNWRRKTTYDLEDIARDPRLATLSDDVRRRVDGERG